MKSIFRNSKHGIAAILTLCIILGIAGTCVNIAVMAEEPAVVTDETTVIVTDEITITTEESTVGNVETMSTIEAIVPELMPTMARECDSKTVYVNSSISISGNVPNATYIYCSGGGGGIGGAVATGTIYSVAQMNNLGQTIWRQDLNSYNGLPLHHGSIYGSHQHNYTWSSYTDGYGSIFWNFIEDIFGLS